MPNSPAVFSNIDEYIKQFSPDIQLILSELRRVIAEAAPQAQEKISYQMPTFYLRAILSILPPIKITSASTLPPPALPRFKKSCPPTREQRARCSFRWASPCRLT